MIVDLTEVGTFDERELRHAEMSIYVGYTLERAQKFEQAVAVLVALSRSKDKIGDHESFRADLDRLMSKRLVELLDRCVEQGLITDEVAGHCERARKRRNNFVHGFFRDHDLYSKTGLAKAFWDVQASHSLFDAVHGLLQNAVMQCATTLGFTEDEISDAQALAQKLQGQAWQ